MGEVKVSEVLVFVGVILLGVVFVTSNAFQNSVDLTPDIAEGGGVFRADPVCGADIIVGDPVCDNDRFCLCRWTSPGMLEDSPFFYPLEPTGDCSPYNNGDYGAGIECIGVTIRPGNPDSGLHCQIALELHNPPTNHDCPGGYSLCKIVSSVTDCSTFTNSQGEFCARTVTQIACGLRDKPIIPPIETEPVIT
jgi:hypothetical protein